MKQHLKSAVLLWVYISDEPVLYWPDDTNSEEVISKLILDYYHESDESLIPVTSYRLLATSVHNDTITGQTKMMESYMLILYQTYSKDISNGDVLTPVTSIYTPAVITWSGGERGYRLAEFWVPQQGSTYEQEIRAKFLDDIVDKLRRKRLAGISYGIIIAEICPHYAVIFIYGVLDVFTADDIKRGAESLCDIDSIDAVHTKMTFFVDVEMIVEKHGVYLLSELPDGIN